jgi:hypothetical protein
MRSWKRLSAPVAGVMLIALLTLFAPAPVGDDAIIADVYADKTSRF